MDSRNMIDYTGFMGDIYETINGKVSSFFEWLQAFVPFTGCAVGSVVLFPMSRFLSVGVLPLDGYQYSLHLITGQP